MGKVKHLDVTDLWIQQKDRSKSIILQKIPGEHNPADILTKCIDRGLLEKALAFYGACEDEWEGEDCTEGNGSLAMTVQCWLLH